MPTNLINHYLVNHPPEDHFHLGMAQPYRLQEMDSLCLEEPSCFFEELGHFETDPQPRNMRRFDIFDVYTHQRITIVDHWRNNYTISLTYDATLVSLKPPYGTSCVNMMRPMCIVDGSTVDQL
jgi:hypothetical protein